MIVGQWDKKYFSWIKKYIWSSLVYRWRDYHLLVRTKTQTLSEAASFYTESTSASVRFTATPASARALNPCNYILSSTGWLEYLK